MIRLARTIWYVVTLRCEEADRVRAVARREDLTRAERFGAWAHTQLCRSCRNARRQADALSRIVRDVAEAAPAEGPDLSGAARSRILDNIDNQSR